MFLTNLFFSIKKIYDWLVYPSKEYSKKYSKRYSKQYVDEYISSQALKVSPSPSLSSSKYAGEDDPTYDYNKY